ncbi:hypothetical protein AMS68_007050 [Peltaster fructicola]|uniref:Nuclear protein DGCR14 n=1 Tax=Peltaster fructicola TaxID=286661 RepID=A0A6H0Y3F0_9PEZI|nr:hypothetical protein AMS68_007050 [Peltaster fructicola]
MSATKDDALEKLRPAAISSVALMKRSADMAMMPPPAKRVKRPAKVLEEDTYASALSHIIARDFFPGLLEGEAQEEYMSAVESKNPAWIREAGRKLTQVMTPGPGSRQLGRGTSFTPRVTRTTDQTPITGQGMEAQPTPMQANIDFDEDPLPHVDVNMSLGAFQARYTSEDNESFNELLDKQNTRRTNKYAHFHYGNKIPTARQIVYQKEHPTHEENKQALIVHNSRGEERQLLAAGRPSQDLDLRPAQLQSFPNRQGPRNAFMFEPDSVEDQLVTAAAEADSRSMAPPKQTNYCGTRFTTTTNEHLVPPSPSMSAIDAAIAGRPRLSVASVDYSGADTPRVNGYAFVDAEPTPSELGLPVTDEDAEQAERQGFDRLLPIADRDGPNPFSIATQSKREDIHTRLVEKADVARRKGGRTDDLRRLGITPGKTPTPRFATGPKKQAGQMTPAAKQLAAKLATPRRGW